MQLHLKILHNYVLINTLILQWFSCLNQAFSLNIIYLWSFQPISILDIFQKLQYPLYCYISLFLNNEWSDICEICCMHFSFKCLIVLCGYCSNMNPFSFILSLNWVYPPAPPTHTSRLKSTRVCASYGCNKK